jgi:hypothetical protein
MNVMLLTVTTVVAQLIATSVAYAACHIAQESAHLVLQCLNHVCSVKCLHCVLEIYHLPICLRGLVQYWAYYHHSIVTVSCCPKQPHCSWLIPVAIDCSHCSLTEVCTSCLCGAGHSISSSGILAVQEGGCTG